MDILQVSRALFIIVGILSFVFGVIFIFKPVLLQKLSQGLNKNILSSDRLQQALEKQINADEWFIKNSKIIGVVVVVLAVTILLQIIIW